MTFKKNFRECQDYNLTSHAEEEDKEEEVVMRGRRKASKRLPEDFVQLGMFLKLDKMYLECVPADWAQTGRPCFYFMSLCTFTASDEEGEESCIGNLVYFLFQCHK